VASSLVKQWQDLSFSSGHISSTFGQPDSWGLIYNLFADRLLATNLVDQTVWHTSFKATLVSDHEHLRYMMRKQVSTTIKPPMVREPQGLLW
jgi:hypothetical protein